MRWETSGRAACRPTCVVRIAASSSTIGQPGHREGDGSGFLATPTQTPCLDGACARAGSRAVQPQTTRSAGGCGRWRCGRASQARRLRCLRHCPGEGAVLTFHPGDIRLGVRAAAHTRLPVAVPDCPAAPSTSRPSGCCARRCRRSDGSRCAIIEANSALPESGCCSASGSLMSRTSSSVDAVPPETAGEATSRRTLVEVTRVLHPHSMARPSRCVSSRTRTSVASRLSHSRTGGVLTPISAAIRSWLRWIWR